MTAAAERELARILRFAHEHGGVAPAPAVQSIAYAVVAAELRRLADAARHFGEGHPWRDGALHMAAGMNARADQLETAVQDTTRGDQQ